MFKYGIIGVLSLFPAGIAIDSNSQSFELSKDNSTISITGTSTLHDWKMYLKTFDCNANFILKGTQLKGIDEVTFNCKATDLKSDYSLMDKKTYSALKSGAFPEIKFNISSPMEISSHTDSFRDTLTGNLFIAGKSKVVTLPLNGTIYNNNGVNIINVSGVTELKMSDFGISPPVFMMGALKTGDRITVSFSLQFIQKSG